MFFDGYQSVVIDQLTAFTNGYLSNELKSMGIAPVGINIYTHLVTWKKTVEVIFETEIEMNMYLVSGTKNEEKLKEMLNQQFLRVTQEQIEVCRYVYKRKY
jgi:predicted DNA-binding transcriptional regulator